MKIAGLDLSISSSGVIVEELDENYKVINLERHGFTTVKKNSLLPGLVFHKIEDFLNDYERYQFFCDHIVNWCKDCDYIAIEDYAYSKSGALGKIFSLAEFEGNIKLSLFRDGHALRFYPPNTNKKFFAGYGSADKIGMKQALESRINCPTPANGSDNTLFLDITDLPPVKKGKDGAKPTSDLIDAYALCEFLRNELRIRNNIRDINSYEKTIIDCFTSKSDENPNGILGIPFTVKRF